MTIEDDDEDAGPTSKSTFSKASAPQPVSGRRNTVTIEEVMDEDVAASPSYTQPSEIIEPGDDKARTSAFSTMAAASNEHATSAFKKQPQSSSSPFGTKPIGIKSSAPKEPSKLRETYVAEKDDDERDGSSTSVPPIPFASALSPKINGFTPTPKMQVNGISTTAQQTSSDPKQAAMDVDIADLPKYDFSLPSSSELSDEPSHVQARADVMAMSVVDLPVYDLTKYSTSADARVTNGVDSTVKPVPVKAFDWAAAGIAPKPKASGGTWNCGTCMLENPASATAKCTVCETPRTPASAPSSSATSATVTELKPEMPKPSSTPIQAFNWAAAGIAPTPKNNGGQWTCGTCMLSNPASATAKCTVCDAPKP